MDSQISIVDTGAIISTDATISIVDVDKAISFARKAKADESKALWCIGDIINAMPTEQERVEAYSRVTHELEYSGSQVVKNICYCCAAIPIKSRRVELSFWKHYPTAPLSSDARDSLLEIAARNKMTKGEIESQVRLLSVASNSAGISEGNHVSNDENSDEFVPATFEQFIRFFVEANHETKIKLLEQLNQIANGGEAESVDFINQLIKQYESGN